MKCKLMRIFLLALALVMAFGAGLALAGCSQTAGDLMAGVKAAEHLANPSEPDEVFVESVAGFSWNLFRESVQNEGNILISPASVYLALGMALNGADRETKTAMLDAMAASGLTLEQLDAACRDWMALLQNVGQETKLTVANSIWFREGFTPDPLFLQKNADFFSAAARALDFNKPEALGVINGWVKDNTQGKIEKIIEQIYGDVVMYLINAVYFKADWKAPFAAAAIKAGDFYKTASETITAQFMYQLDSMDYIAGEGAQGILLPYKDGRFAYVALLPDENGDPRQLVASLTADKLASLLHSRVSAMVDLRLPKYETTYEDSLKNELAAMGMGIAFEGGQADFSLMNAAHENNLFISEVKHKTYCRVDEKGTEAAAVTSIEVSKTSMPQVDHELIFNRPFVYGIFDTTTGLPLFLGIMEDPAKK